MSVESGCQIIYGPMMSGKSTHLYYLVSVYSKFNKVLVVTCNLDIRKISGELHGITTHNKSISGEFENVKSTRININELENLNVNDFSIIAIDEAQFFVGLNDVVRHWVEDLKKYVIVCGLIGDVNKNVFGEIVQLLPICDNSPIVMNAKCVPCYEKSGKIKNAYFTDKYNSINKLTHDENILDVGGDEKYYPTCKHHHHCW